MSLRSRSIVLIAALVACCLILHYTTQPARANDRFNLGRNRTAVQDDTQAGRAFDSMVAVLHHPRCMNCHSNGDFPRQGDDSHQHKMNVRRGPEGDGVAGVHCATCHQDHNLDGQHLTPGAPDWHLPSPQMPMIWQGLSDRQLCELFKDPQQSGNRTVDQIVEHMTTPLVLWGWNPGDGRTPIPTPYAEFMASVKVWASNGAGCPADH